MLPEDLQLPKYPVVKTLDFNYDKIVCIGDVHGCYSELMELLEVPAVKTALSPSYKSTLIFLGDLVDKGPYSGKVIEWISNNNELGKCYSVMGNHSEKIIRYEQYRLKGGKNPMKVNEAFIESHTQLTPKNILWLSKLPAAIRWQEFLFIHAGLVPGLEFGLPLKGFLRIRYLEQKDGRYYAVGTWQDPDGTWRHSKDSIHWTEAYKGSLKVVYGHEPLQDVRIYNNTIGLDTSCVLGNRLTAMIIDTKTKDISFESVPAKRNYTT